MKRIRLEHEFTSEEREKVRFFAQTLSVTATTAGILYARGMDTCQKMYDFLHPGKEHFLSPYLMQDMREAVSLIRRARDEEWNVAVFGDYDADGIGAIAILFRALKEYGIQPYLYIPERSEGYGMSVSALDKIFDEFLPDLIITVDCGISNADEVEYIKEQGAYVIVTDHHELPAHLPDCICINPKFKDEYPYDNLCGAGVAFKLATALIGDKANDLLDFCALSTVADSVPLLGENRDIVAEGLKLFSSSLRPAFKAILGNQEEVTAQTLSFMIAPRVNAAGRLGDASAALRLFTSEDEEEISLLAQKLNLYNAERQKLCDVLYESARRMVRSDGAIGNVAMAIGENWQSGLVGIAAARIAEEFSRPALLFVRSGDMLRGSARSIENVNIYEALCASSQYIEEFGGHSQAAGVNLRAARFDELKTALNEYFATYYVAEDFIPTLYVSELASGEDMQAVAREMSCLEPFGVGNRRPLFCMDAQRIDAAPIKSESPHLAFAANGLDFMYFNGEKDLPLLRSPIPKTTVFEYNISKFRGREYLKGYVRAVVYDGREGDTSLECLEALLSTLKGEKRAGEALSDVELKEFLRSRSSHRYGLCVVAYSAAALRKSEELLSLPVDIFTLSSGGAQSTALLSPLAGIDLSAFSEIVFLEESFSVPYVTGDACLYFGEDTTSREALKACYLPREELLKVYGALRSFGGAEGRSLAEAARSLDLAPLGLSFCTEQLIAALAIFEELGLIAREEGIFHLVRGKKSDLKMSKIFTRLSQMQ